MESKVLLSIIFLFLISVTVIIFVDLCSEEKNQVCFKEYCFDIELAVTEQEKSQGLMSRERLAFDEGMLFVFVQEGEYSFWMKNVLIPLDIIWINKEKEVVFIKEDFQPCGEEPCFVVTPDRGAKYVLELQGGAVDRIRLQVGDRLDFYIK